jgi:glutathione S-transferase
MGFELFYWPGIGGRGEYVRLAFEEAGADYVDVVRIPESEGGGIAALLALLEASNLVHPPFAPPFLRDGDIVIGQTAAILFYLGERLGLAPQGEAERMWVHQIQLTIADFVGEIHDTHHPVSGELYYEDQKPEASRRAAHFREERMPKYLGWFERVLANNPAGSDHLAGASVTYADLSLFQTVAGLLYAFPRCTAEVLRKFPRVAALYGAVAVRPRIRTYLASERRIAFNQEDIFRHYPELDG